MSNNISHPGKVVAIEGDTVKVAVKQTSACAGCHANKACLASDARSNRLITAKVPQGRFEVGEEVQVTISKSLGRRAVMLSYIYPTLLVLAALVVGHMAHVPDLVMALLAPALAGLYFLALRLYEKRASSKQLFDIEKITNTNKL